MLSQHQASDRKENRSSCTLLYTTIFAVISCIGGTLLCNYKTVVGFEIIEDYTDCTSWKTKRHETKCMDILNATGEGCYCYKLIMITEPMNAPVTVFYELDSYDQIINKYSQSRDDNQLAGDLSGEPSESCGSYTYACTATGRKPIAPCGQLADAMFNDTFNLHFLKQYLNSSYTGLIPEDDKKLFHNPDSAENLSQAFKEFEKPMNWKKNVWELDTINADNNGFQNEAFIIWMKTDLKRKPAWRVKHEGKYKHGLPVGNYTLRVGYEYPPSRYDGRRKFIISSIQESVNSTQYAFGVALLVIGITCLIFNGLLLLRRSMLQWCI